MRGIGRAEGPRSWRRGALDALSTSVFAPSTHSNPAPLARALKPAPAERPITVTNRRKRATVTSWRSSMNARTVMRSCVGAARLPGPAASNAIGSPIAKVPPRGAPVHSPPPAGHSSVAQTWRRRSTRPARHRGPLMRRGRRAHRSPRSRRPLAVSASLSSRARESPGASGARPSCVFTSPTKLHCPQGDRTHPNWRAFDGPEFDGLPIARCTRRPVFPVETAQVEDGGRVQNPVQPFKPGGVRPR
jgi:hypothetical protein